MEKQIQLHYDSNCNIYDNFYITKKIENMNATELLSTLQSESLDCSILKNFSEIISLGMKEFSRKKQNCQIYNDFPGIKKHLLLKQDENGLTALIQVKDLAEKWSTFLTVNEIINLKKLNNFCARRLNTAAIFPVLNTKMLYFYKKGNIKLVYKHLLNFQTCKSLRISPWPSVMDSFMTHVPKELRHLRKLQILKCTDNSNFLELSNKLLIKINNS